MVLELYHRTGAVWLLKEPAEECDERTLGKPLTTFFKLVLTV